MIREASVPARRALASARRCTQRAYLRTGKPARGEPRVLYGTLRSPRSGDHAWGGGMVGLIRAQQVFPPAGRDFNVFYVGSSAVALVPDVLEILLIAKRRGAVVVLNQDGIGRPGWGGWTADDPDVQDDLIPRTLVHEADYVLFQSAFCRACADYFVGPRAGPAEILYNAVDTSVFAPAPRPPAREGLVLMLGGNQVQPDRLAAAVRTLAHVVEERPDATLLVTGIVRYPEDELMRKLGVADRVRFTGTYAIADAPAMYRQADIMLHTRPNDPCPYTVIEAMASGLPVVHAMSGGTPELVGGEAGIGVPVEHSWERDVLPDPATMAAGVLEIVRDLPAWSAAARRRAVERFDGAQWAERLREVVTGLVHGA